MKNRLLLYAFIGLLVPVLMIGCVSKKKYIQSQGALQNVRNDSIKLANKVAELEMNITSLNESSATLQQNLNNLKQQLDITSKDAAGKIIGASAIARDISEQKRLQTESYEQQQRKDEFISMASHELKTPVTSLKGFTNVLQRRLTQQGDEQTLHYLSRMDFQLYKLTKIINDLLDVSKMQSGQLSFQKEPFELDSLIQETVEDVQAATLSHHFLIEGKTGIQILGDKDRLEQVFINLLTNAVKYSPQADKVLVSLLCTQKEAIVSVKDFGIGIDESYHHKIFERFYQFTDPEEKTYPGLGMGLYISKEIVDRHQGRMWVESRKGEGASFYVALPILQEDNLESSGINVQ